MRSEVLEAYVVGEESEASGAGGLRLLDVLIVLARRRRFIGLFTITAAALTAAIVLLVPNRYTAVTLLMPPNQNSSMSSALLGQLANSGGLASIAGTSLGIKNPNDMFVSFFRSQTIEDAMIHRFGLMARYHAKKESDARDSFEGHSTVALGVKDGLIRITVTDRDPKAAADMANGYVEEFKKLSANLAIGEASQRRMFFQQQLMESKENLATAEEALKRTEQSTGVLQIDSQSRALIESAATLRAQIGAKEVQLQGMRSYAAEGNPDVILAEQELAALRAQLAKLAGTDGNSTSDIIVPRGKVPEAGLEYIRRLRDVKYYETISDLIAKQFEMAKLDEAREGALIQVIDVAQPPDKKSSPHRSFIVLGAGLVSFLVACFWVIVRALWEEQRLKPEVQRRLQLLRAK